MTCRNRRAALALLVGAPLVAMNAAAEAAEPARDTAPMALVGATVLPMTGGPPIEAATLMIQDGRILSITADGGASMPAGSRRIDVDGRFVMPGLIDTHVHLRNTDAHALQRYLGAGITTIREMNGRPLLLQWRDGIERGEIAGPTMVVAAPTAGNFSSPRIGYSTPESVEEGRAWVRRFHDEGYEWIKVYSFLPAAGFRGVMAEARRLGMPVGGHVPVEVGLKEALRSGIRSIEHLTEYVGSSLTPASRELDERDGRSVFHAGELDSSALDSLIALTVEQAVWNVPTITWFDRNLPAPQLVRPWSDQALRDQGKSNRREILRRLYAAKALLAIGTDSDDGGDLSADAIHDELGAWFEAGLPAGAVLQAATIAGARLLGLQEEVGSLEAGKRADLLVLYCDPRVDIACVREPELVIARGRIRP